MLDKEEWCIVRWRDGELLTRRVYQWEAQAAYYFSKWEYVARGLTEKQAMEYRNLFKE